ncbi:hypothetical protein SAMD00079811_45650 [Scytonema sp. HK-05]|nr:hypothetical protein [Scytonema sp. HK-05]BAY46949.1 hypothetical protein SAMD00079811_45650 [Scytonema sp. HK-05]
MVEQANQSHFSHQPIADEKLELCFAQKQFQTLIEGAIALCHRRVG